MLRTSDITRPIYLIECDFGERLGTAISEVRPADKSFTDEAELIKDIMDGQYERILSIHLVDCGSGTVKNVTTQIAAHVHTKCLRDVLVCRCSAQFCGDVLGVDLYDEIEVIRQSEAAE